jgi:hypothetical protein
MSVVAVLCGGVPLSAALAVGLAGSPAGPAPATGIAPRFTAATLTAANARGSLRACEAYAVAAIERQQVAVAAPAACRGLSRAEVNQAASTAIRMTETPGSKAVLRREAIARFRWVRAMFTSPAPASGVPVASAATARPSADGTADSTAGAPGLGGVSELAAKVGALLAWLAAAASGGWVLARWLVAGGRPLRRTMTAAPPVVILGHAGGAALGLLLWACFMLSGWVALAWAALAILAPVSGLGMSVLLLGLPGPPRTRAAGRGRIPALAIAAHGVFAVTALLLVLMATIGAG